MPPTWSDSVGALRMRVVRGGRRLAVGGESGSMLIEVMVGALVLALATAAVLDGVDGAQRVGAANKQRSVAATLAQQDIERMRSMPVTALANFGQTRTVDVSGVSYNVVSSTDWVREASGVVSCTDDSTQAEYIRISSTVHSPSAADRPVTERTLLTPAPGAFSTTLGTATVRVIDRDGAPREGVNVALSGPQSLTKSTNKLGCAVFAYIPAGNYVATVDGLVGWESELPATSPVTVGEGKTSLTQMELENPASLRAQFRWPADIPSDWSLSVPTWKEISVAHTKLRSGVKVFPSPDAGNLFPHRDGYGVYAGDCQANNPAFWNPSYFQEDGPGYVQLEPGDFLETVDVHLATLRVVVTRGSADFPARVRVTQDDHPNEEIDCSQAQPLKTQPADANVHVFDFQLPLGNYTVCADDTSHGLTKAVDLTAPRHHDETIQVPDAGAVCP